MEGRLSDLSTQAQHAENSEDVETDIECDHHEEDRHSHFHYHLHDDFELFDFLEQVADAQIADQESEGEHRGSLSVRTIGAIRGEHLQISHDGDGLAHDFDDVELLLLDDARSAVREDDHAALDEEKSSERDGKHPPEARPDLLLRLELVVDDEKDRDGQVEQDQDHLDPAVEETGSIAILDGPLVAILLNLLTLQLGERLEAVDVLDLGDLDEVGQLEEREDVLLLVVAAQVVHVDDLKDLLRCVPVHLIMVVEIEDGGKELLSFHVVERLALICVMAVEEQADVVHALLNSLLPFALQALLVLVEDVGEEQIGQEVEADQHEEHEEEGVEVVDVHGGKEDVGEVRRREQNRHVPVRIPDR